MEKYWEPDDWTETEIRWQINQAEQFQTHIIYVSADYQSNAALINLYQLKTESIICLQWLIVKRKVTFISRLSGQTNLPDSLYQKLKSVG